MEAHFLLFYRPTFTKRQQNHATECNNSYLSFYFSIPFARQAIEPTHSCLPIMNISKTKNATISPILLPKKKMQRSKWQQLSSDSSSAWNMRTKMTPLRHMIGTLYFLLRFWIHNETPDRAQTNGAIYFRMLVERRQLTLIVTQYLFVLTDIIGHKYLLSFSVYLIGWIYTRYSCGNVACMRRKLWLTNTTTEFVSLNNSSTSSIYLIRKNTKIINLQLEERTPFSVPFKSPIRNVALRSYDVAPLWRCSRLQMGRNRNGRKVAIRMSRSGLMCHCVMHDR